MDKIRIDFFDILGYLIPGSAFLLLLWITFDDGVRSIWDMYPSVNKADQKTLLIGLVMAYIAGFTLHAFGSSIYNLYREKFGVLKQNKNAKGLSVQEKWVLIREKGEKHISILERWYALRALAQNLSAVALIFVIVCFYKWAKFGYWEWGVLSLVSMFFSGLMLRRSEIFRENMGKDIEAIMNKLELS